MYNHKKIANDIPAKNDFIRRFIIAIYRKARFVIRNL